MRNVTKIAKLMNSRSRMCTICPLGKQMRCNLDIMRVCSDAFVEGFKKGVQLAEKNYKEQAKKEKRNEKSSIKCRTDAKP